MTLTKEQMDVKLKAVAFVWRLCYEGLGLSGYSPRATAAMRVIDCAKSDSEKGWRVAKRLNSNDLAYDYAFKIGEELPSNQWRAVSGPAELVELLGDDTKITKEIAKELIQSAAVLRTYKKIESEGLVAIGERSGYFKFINDAVIQGSLRRIGQGNTGDMEPDIFGDDGSDPDYNPDTAPGKSLQEIMAVRQLAANIKFDPLAQLSHKIAVSHQLIREAHTLKLKRDEEEGYMS